MSALGWGLGIGAALTAGTIISRQNGVGYRSMLGLGVVGAGALTLGFAGAVGLFGHALMTPEGLENVLVSLEKKGFSRLKTKPMLNAIKTPLSKFGTFQAKVYTAGPRAVGNTAWRLGYNTGTALINENTIPKLINSAGWAAQKAMGAADLGESAIRRTFLDWSGKKTPMDAWFPHLNSGKATGLAKYIPNAALMVPILGVGGLATVGSFGREVVNYQKAPAPTIYYDGTNMRHTKDLGADGSYAQAMMGNASTFSLDDATKHRLLQSFT